MRIAIAALFTLIVVSTVTPSHADPYRYCSIGGNSGHGSNCYFLTLEQCRASIAGGGGFCQENGLYDGRPVSTPGDATRPAKKRKQG